MTKKNNYSGESIQILKGLDAVRKRHSMYLGSLDEMTNQLAKEVIDNANDEFARGYATDTWVYLDTKLNQLTVIDNGRGLPTDIHPAEGIPTMEVIFGTLHSGTNFDDNNSDHTAGTNGVGSSSTNAMSTMFRAESIRNGYIYSIEFSEGKVTKKFSKRKRKENEYPEIQETGTVIKFIPDETIIKEFHKFNPSFLKENLHIRAYVNAGLRTHLKIDDNKMIDYYHEDGIKDLLETMVNKPFSKPYYFKETDPKTGDTFEVAFQYDSNSDENIKSFVNGIVTSKGKHLTGFKMGLTNSITKFMEEKNIFTKKINKDSVSGDDIRSGLVCIINAKMKNALYSSQTKDELTNPEVFGLLSKYTNQNITQFTSENEKDFKTITGRIIKFAQGRMNANKYKDSVVKTSVGLSLQFSNNFNPCAEKDPSKIELIIVEGKSAGTSISGGRDPLTQAYYTLRGKIKNVYGVRHSNLVSNEEINELMLIVFGTNKPSELSEADSRYGSIIFTCDADDDGRIRW